MNVTLPRGAPTPVRKKAPVDRATVAGLACGLAMIVLAIVIGGSPRPFINAPSLLIVLGGTFCVVTICYSLRDVVNALGVTARALLHTGRDPGEAAMQVLALAERARQAGVLQLQTALPGISAHPLLQKGVSLAVDGIAAETLEAILIRDLQATRERDATSAGVLRKAAEYAPAMGLIGTLIGLVQMMGNLEDPAAIGPSMAVALLTTLYGAILANLVFSPLATRLDRLSAADALLNQIYLLGAVSIGRQENPRALEILLNSVLPPAERVRYFD
ncbi:MAG: MotA/TolQ/ExbB proton channel family protein [Rhodospirillales bacterium]|nr:MotA/TolQ/ExbB proton channel family protein [Rhodospirillales bacterium]